MSEEPVLGLRERKKQATRRAISDVATMLFLERGFDRVTLAEVAAAAGVSVNTVFNYFSTKEELFFDREDELVEELSSVLSEAPPGVSPVDAFERHVRRAVAGKVGLLFQSSDRITRFFRTIDESPALRARQLVMAEKTERRLAAVIAERTGAKKTDPTPQVIATLMSSVLFMLVREFRARLLRGEAEKRIRAALARLAMRSFSLLRGGTEGAI